MPHASARISRLPAPRRRHAKARAAVPSRRSRTERCRLARTDAGPHRGLGRGYHPVDKTAEGFRVKDSTAAGRTYWVTINRGPAGSPGETYDLDTNQSVDTTERQAQLNGLRAMFVIPAGSYYGLVFVERVGRRNLRDLLTDIAIRRSSTSAGAILRLEAFAEIEDWRRELTDMQVLRVSETFVKKDSGEDASTAQDTIVKVSAEGGRLHAISDGLKGIFTNRIERRDTRLALMQRSSELAEKKVKAGQDGVTFQDEEELQRTIAEIKGLNDGSGSHDTSLTDVVDDVLPVDRDALTHKRFEFALGVQRPERNIVIEADSIPQFVYELGGRLTDGALRNTWVDHAERILRVRGVDLPTGWDRDRRRAAKKG